MNSLSLAGVSKDTALIPGWSQKNEIRDVGITADFLVFADSVDSPDLTDFPDSTDSASQKCSVPN